MYYFIINVNTLIVFLAITYSTKLKTINQFSSAMISDDGSHVRMDIWNNSKTSDFLHNLKFEYMNAKLQLTDLCLAIFLCYKLFKEGSNNVTFVTPFIGFALINLV